jgi:hypothetical protein
MTTRRTLLTAATFVATGALGLAADHSKDIRKTFALNPQGRVSVDTYKGLVRVTTWDQPQVEVEVRIESDGWSASDREMVRDTEIEFDASADSVRMRTRSPKRMGWQYFGVSNPITRYTIRMPRTASLRIKDYKSEIDVDGLAAALQIDTYKGDVHVRRQGGALDVKTYKSEARVSFANYNARSSFETYRGTYDISLPRDSRFDVVSEAGRRANVDTSFQMMMPAGSRSDRGNFRAAVNGGGPAMILKGYRGDFRIR